MKLNACYCNLWFGTYKHHLNTITRSWASTKTIFPLSRISEDCNHSAYTLIYTS